MSEITEAIHRPLLIFDLDETLIHGAEKTLHREADFKVGPFHIYKRPGLDTFLSKVDCYYDLAIWSSATGDYVHEIAGALRASVKEWRFIWSRGKCIQITDEEWVEPVYLKDLKKIKRRGYHLERALILEDSPKKVSRNYGNAIYISKFIGSDEDRELITLANFLVQIHTAENFRKIEKRGWRSHSK